MFGFHSLCQHPNIFLNPTFLFAYSHASFFIFPQICFSISPSKCNVEWEVLNWKNKKMGSIISTASNHHFKYFDYGIPNGNGEFITNEQTILVLLAFYKVKRVQIIVI